MNLLTILATSLDIRTFRLKLAKRTNDQLFKEDATFCVVQGLANSSGRSFESFNFPKHYIRHSNFELWIGEYDGTRLFKRDATFFIERPLTIYPPPVSLKNDVQHNPVSE